MARNPELPEIIEWEAYEGLHATRSIDWFWGVGLTGVIIGIIAILLGNILLALLSIIGCATIVLLSLKTPQLRYYALTPRGIIEENKLYLWAELNVFWIQETDPPTLLVQSTKSFVPMLDLPLPETVDSQLVFDYLFQYIDDEFLRHSTLHQLMNRLGFY